MSDTSRSQNPARFLRARPALPMALLLIAGILSHRIMPANPICWIAISAVAIAVAAISSRRPSSAIAFTFSIFACGVAAAQLNAFYFPIDHIGRFTQDEPRLAQVELKLDESPKIFSDPFAKLHRSPEHQSFNASVLRVLTPDGWQACSGEVSVHLPHPNTQLSAGQTLRAIGYLQRPLPAMNPGQFDWAERSRRERVLATLSVPHADDITVLHSPGPSFLENMRSKTRSLLAAGFSDKHSIDHAMLRALFLGDNDPELRDVRDAFQHTGTAHLLAISGLHVVIVGAFVFGICRLLRLHPRRAAWITCIVVVLYGTVALPSAPAVRAIALCLAVTFALLHRRQVNPVHLLSLIAFIMLLWRPLEIYTPGFQLSFGCVLGLMTLGSPVVGVLRRTRDRDLEIAESFRPASGLRASLRHVRDHAEQALAGGLVAFAISIPIVEAHFSQLNPWSIPCSILLAPLTFASIVAGMLKIVLTLLLPWFATTWAMVAAGPIALLRMSAETLEKLPLSDIPLRSPPRAVSLLYYAAILLAFAPLTSAWGKRVARTAVACTFATFLLFPFVAGFTREKNLKITLLSVGAGQCVVIEPPGADPILLDAGSSTIPELEHDVIEPFLRFEGRDRLGVVYLSHGDYDHISAVSDLVARYDPIAIYTSPHLPRHAAESYPCRQLLDRLHALDRDPHFVAAGDTMPLDHGDTTLDILWPPPVSRMSSNNCGLVLKIHYAGKTILFPADIQADAERALLEHPALLKSDILVAPHHGSSEVTTPDFIAAVDPQTVLSSNSHRLTQKQKTFNQIVTNRKLYRTDRYGAITLTIDKTGAVTLTPFRRPD